MTISKRSARRPPQESDRETQWRWKGEGTVKKILFPVIASGIGLIMMATAALAAGPQYKLRVDGLACPFCAYGIEKKLSEVKGVDNVDTDIASETVTVTMKDGQTLDKAAAEKAVKAAGFSLRGMQDVQAPNK
jgi:copper chaperone CopZ